MFDSIDFLRNVVEQAAHTVLILLLIGKCVFAFRMTTMAPAMM